MSSLFRLDLVLLDDLGDVLIVDEQRLRRLLHLFRALIGGDLLRGEAVVQFLSWRARRPG